MKITVELERLSDGRIKATAITSGGEDGIWSIRDDIQDAMAAVAPVSLTEDAPEKPEGTIGRGALPLVGGPTAIKRRVAVEPNDIARLLEEAALDGSAVKINYRDGIGKHSQRVVEPQDVIRKKPAGGMFPERALLADDGEAVKTFYLTNGVSGARIERAEII